MHRLVCEGWRFRYQGGIQGQQRPFPEVYDRPTPVEIPRAIPPDLGILPTPVIASPGPGEERGTQAAAPPARGALSYDPPDRAARALSPADREAAETLWRARVS